MSGEVLESAPRTVLSRDQLSERCGCLAKLDGVELSCMLGEAYQRVPGVGPAPTEQVEDCAVLPRLEGQVLASIDFGPLVCPEPLRAGRIAALHALSDVYATGGGARAALAMLVVDSLLPGDATAELMAGMIEACSADGVQIVGGHTIVGPEAMAGLAVIGVAPGGTLTKGGARPGDLLLLSKPIGGGLLLRAFRQGLIGVAELEEALSWMERSNLEAGRAALVAGVSVATDVTGFGLLGHLAEMLGGSGLGASLDFAAVPVVAAARCLPDSLYRSSWIGRNVDYCRASLQLPVIARPDVLGILADPQTSGGLLVAASAPRAAALNEVGFHTIGSVTDKPQVEVSL